MYFLKYFPDSQEFPGGNYLRDEILPFGELWEYVSSSFLNGFINCGKPILATVVSRYNKADEVLEFSDSNYQTKRQAISNFLSNSKFHAPLSFGDDIWIVSKVENDNGHYYIFFWCDCDVSDCCVGRFKTKDSEEEVKKYFLSEANRFSQNENGENSIEIPVNTLKGWLKF